jgi:hypothetical protein
MFGCNLWRSIRRDEYPAAGQTIDCGIINFVAFFIAPCFIC